MPLGGYQTCLSASTFRKSGPRKDKRGVDLISDALPFGRLWQRARIVFDCRMSEQNRQWRDPQPGGRRLLTGG